MSTIRYTKWIKIDFIQHKVYKYKSYKIEMLASMNYILN